MKPKAARSDARRVRSLAWLGAAAPAVLSLACASATMPDPRAAAVAYAEAAARGDAYAVHAMLGEEGRRALTLEEVRAKLADAPAEHADRAKQLRSAATRVEARATVRYVDGEESVLELEDGRFRVTSVDALPAGARTPAQALEQLRRVLSRRSYAGLMRVLTPATRSAIETDLRSLVLGLEHPEGLEVEISGESATVQVPGGHEVKLRREGGTWRVEDFD